MYITTDSHSNLKATNYYQIWSGLSDCPYFIVVCLLLRLYFSRVIEVAVIEDVASLTGYLNQSSAICEKHSDYSLEIGH